MEDVDEKPIILHPESFNQMCRTCLSTPEVMYEIVDLTIEDIPLGDVLNDFMSIKVDEDELPQHICVSCTAKLCEAFSFKKMCLESEVLLQQALNNKERLVEHTEDTIQREETILKDESNTDTSKCPLVCLVEKNSEPPHEVSTHKRINTTDTQRVSCNYCPASFTAIRNLKRHEMIHTGERPHLCAWCGKAFIQKGSMIEHCRIHTGEKPYKCPNCGRVMARHAAYKKHLDGGSCLNLLNKYNCKKCFGSYPTMSELNTHECDDSVLACKICSRTFVTRLALRKHVNTHKAPRHYTCKICKENFTSRILYIEHNVQHRNFYRECRCGLSFSTYTTWLAHKKMHAGTDTFTCDICQKVFRHLNAYQMHKLMHTGERPYSCEVCNKTFIQQAHLVTHMRIHTGEKPYQCNYCGKAFASNGTLTVHRRIHTGETPYVCDLCKKGFYHSSTMKKHRKMHFKGVKIEEENVDDEL